MRRFATLLMLAAFATAPAAAQQDVRVPASRAEIALSFAPVVEKASPAVVNVYSARKVRRRSVSPLFEDPFFRRFFGIPRQEQERRRVFSLGSGVVVSPDGIIVTNAHVIEGAEEVTVVFGDRREFQAEILVRDERTDLAVLRVDPGGDSLPYLEMASSDDLAVGDLVLAIGNPLGVGKTVTSGIVSALARTNVGVTDYRFFIQTDAAINRGNSGGALVTMDGRLAGINTFIFSGGGSDGSIGIGFAVPAEMARAVVAGVVGGAGLARPWLGATGQPVTADIAESLGLERPGGVLLNAIHPDSPAARAGLKVGDIVAAIDGHEVPDPRGLQFRIATQTVGDIAKLTVLRKGRRLRLDLPVALPPEVPPRNATLLEGPHPLAGAEVANLSPALAEEKGWNPMQHGVVILRMVRGSPAHRLGFEVGDVVLGVNGAEIKRVGALNDLLAALRGSAFEVVIRRDGRTLSTVFR